MKTKISIDSVRAILDQVEQNSTGMSADAPLTLADVREHLDIVERVIKDLQEEGSEMTHTPGISDAEKYGAYQP